MASIRGANETAVPTGTVDLPTTRSPGFRWGAGVDRGIDEPQVRAGPVDLLRSADGDEMDLAVGGGCHIGAEHQLPAAMGLCEEFGQAGFEERGAPSARASIFAWSTSMPTTSCPREAIAAAWTAPR